MPRAVIILLVLLGSFPASAGAAEPLAIHRLTPGWATFGQALPPGRASHGLALGGLPTQCDVKTRWNDGSIRFAVVTARIPRDGEYSLLPAAARVGSVAGTAPAAAVRFRRGADQATATLPATPGGDRWLDGPEVVEWRVVAAPTGPALAPATLQVIFDVRCYRDGQRRVDVTVENPFDRAGATRVPYDRVDIEIDGIVRFHRDAVTHWYLARWRQVFGVGLDESAIVQDTAPLVAARAVPDYLPSITDETPAMGATFEILRRGGLSYDDMGAPGGRPELGPYPDWAARWLVHRRPEQRAYMLACGDLAASQPIHVREPDGRLPSIDERPQLWLDERGKQWVPESDKPRGDLTRESIGPLGVDFEHQVSLAYVPYLAAGDRFYADEMAFWANYCLIGNHPFYNRQNEHGLLVSGAPRGMAWTLRNVVDAAAWLPDGHAIKAHLAAKVRATLRWFDAYVDHRADVGFATRPGGWGANGGPWDALGTSFEQVNPWAVGYERSVFVIQWQQNYLAWSLAHAAEQGFTEGGQRLRARIVDFQLRLFRSAADYPREYAAPYVLRIGAVGSGGDWTPFTGMAAVFAANYRAADGSVVPPNQFSGYYGIDARLSLLQAIRLGRPGAQEAYDWLLPQVAYDLRGIGRGAGFAIASISAAPPTVDGAGAGGRGSTGTGSGSGGGGAGGGGTGAGGSPRCGMGGLVAALALASAAIVGLRRQRRAQP